MKNFLLLFILLPVFTPAQIISTVAGCNVAGYTGDLGPATLAEMRYPRAVAIDAAGNLYIAESSNHVIRKVTPGGIITTIAGTGTAGYSGDGAAATAAQLYIPWGLTLDNTGNIYFSDTYNNVVRKINTAGVISTIAGNGFGAGLGTGGYAGDGGPATAAQLFSPYGLAIDTGGNIFVAEYKNNVVRKINTMGIISTVAGTGIAGYSGDGSAATAAKLYYPSSVAFDRNNALYICDFYNNVIRKIGPGGTISTVIGSGYLAGTGGGGFSGDGGPATAAELAHPFDLDIDTSNNIYFSDVSSYHIRKVDAAGIINTIAGNGISGYSGDGGPATAAQMSYPYGIALNAIGELFIADAFNHVVRKLSGPITLKTGETETALSGINVFPNPACNTVYISSQMQITSVSISHTSGAVISTYQNHTTKASIDITNFSPGEYLLRINGSEVRKFVKE